MTTKEQQRIADRLFKSDVILAIKKCAGRASEEYREDVVNDVFLAIVTSKHPFEFFEKMPDNEFKFYVIRIATNNATYEFKKSSRLTNGEAFEIALKLNRDTTDEAEMMERELEFLQKMERYERWAALYPRLAIWAQNELEGRRAAAESNNITENSVKWVASKCREKINQLKQQLTLDL